MNLFLLLRQGKKELRKLLYLYKPQIIHFAGHGNTNGIIIEDDDNQGQLITSERLAEFMRHYANDIEFVFLNSCYSRQQGELIRRYIGSVIGVIQDIPDDEARNFSKLFYEGLVLVSDSGHEDLYWEAYKYALNGLPLDGFSEDSQPIFL